VGAEFDGRTDITKQMAAFRKFERA
jgi:hypothetical protein